MTTDKDTTDSFRICSCEGDLSLFFPEGKAARTPLYKVFLALVLRGKAVVEIGGKRYSLCSGTMIYLYPNRLVRLLSRTDDFLYEYLWFEFDFLSDFPLLRKADTSRYIGSNPCLWLREKDRRMAKGYYDFIAERHRESGGRLLVVEGLLFSFLLEVNELYLNSGVSISVTRQEELTDRFFFLLHLHYKEKRSVLFYADKLCVSDKYLMRVLKTVTGNTFHFWATDFILREAKLLLRSTTLPVTEISERLNYPNPSFFSRVFRQYTGMTPREFRKKKRRDAE